MADWTSADLARRLLTKLGRGNGGVMVFDELFTESLIYELLADAQEVVYGDFAPIVPWAFVSVPTLMETFDGGITYEIPQWMFGHTEIYAQENGALPLYQSNYGNIGGGTFVFEGSRIRMAGNRPRQFAHGPYARYVGMPGRLSPTRQPDLRPDEARALIVWQAMVGASQVSQAMLDPATWERQYDKARERWQLLFQTSYTAPQAGPERTAWSWQLSLSAFNQ